MKSLDDIVGIGCLQSGAYGRDGMLDAWRSLQVTMLSAALGLVSTSRETPKSARRAARVLIPYCAHPMVLEDRVILLNRSYKPIGIAGVHVQYEAEQRWHIPKSLVGKLGLDEGYFFNDWSAPWNRCNKQLADKIEQLIDLICASPYPWSENGLYEPKQAQVSLHGIHHGPQ